jgi:hypothetical protein
MVGPAIVGFLLCRPRSTNSSCANRSHYKQSGSEERDTHPNQRDQVGETTSMSASTAAVQRRTS